MIILYKNVLEIQVNEKGFTIVKTGLHFNTLEELREFLL
jgi:hypothetical protein